MDCDDQNGGCTGGWMYEAYDYVQQNGIALRNDYHHYLGGKAKCDTSMVNKNWHFKNTGMEERDEMTNDEIKHQIMKQPIGAAIYAPGRLMSYQSGIVTEKWLGCSRDSYEVNHGVTIIGFGVASEKELDQCLEYWIVRNSWGPTWGDHGTFKLCMDGAQTGHMPYGTCHINEFGAWPTV